MVRDSSTLAHRNNKTKKEFSGSVGTIIVHPEASAGSVLFA